MRSVALLEAGVDGLLAGGIDALAELREAGPGPVDAAVFGPGVEATLAAAARLLDGGELLAVPGGGADIGAVATLLSAELPAGPLLAAAGADGAGTALAAMLAALRGLAHVSGARRVRRRGPTLEVRRGGLAGLVEETVVVPAGGVTLSLLPGRRPAPRSGRGPSRVRALPAPAPPRIRVLLVSPPDAATMDLRDAPVVVAGGQGAGPEGFALLGRLADRLGAALGGTRVAVDRGWLPFARQIGSTGRVIAPDLYLAFGISGATQHTVGVLGARHIVAVNTDPNAPLLGLAELSLVGDLFEVLPRLLDRLPGRDDDEEVPT